MGQGLMAKDTEGVDSGDIASGDVSGAMLLQPPTVEDVRKCQFHCWYPKFSPKYVGKVESLVLEDDFVSYLKQDGISVPKTSRVFGRPASASSSCSSSSREEDQAASDSEEEEDIGGASLEKFSDLISKIDTSIASLEGYVMPRLNWTCPKDATWLNPLSTLRCDNADEIILMLKGSDRVMDDILHAFENCSDYDPSALSDHKHVLNLRKWYDFSRQRELRCFVVNTKLAGVSQRYLNEDTADLESEKDEILEKVKDFFKKVVRQRVELKSYAFDIHISKTGRMTMIDVNQCSNDTNPLLFTWEELFELEGGEEQTGQGGDTFSLQCELRLVSSAESSATVSEKAVYGFPYDFVSSDSKDILASMMDEMELQRREDSS